MRPGDLIVGMTRAVQAAGAYWQHPTVTPRQFALLRALADLAADGKENERINQMRITAATGMDRSTLADVLRRLEQRKLIRRRRDKDDRRSLIVALTPEGRAQLAEVEKTAAEVERWMLSSIHVRHHAGFSGGIESLAQAHSDLVKS